MMMGTVDSPRNIGLTQTPDMANSPRRLHLICSLWRLQIIY